MVASAGFVAFLQEQLAPLGAVAFRRMFGKTGVFCDGVMLGMANDDALYLRVDDGNRETFREAAASPPLSYEKGGERIDLAFWPLPDRLMDEPEEFVAWARAALAAARRAAAASPSHGIPASLNGDPQATPHNLHPLAESLHSPA